MLLFFKVTESSSESFVLCDVTCGLITDKEQLSIIFYFIYAAFITVFDNQTSS